MEKLTRYIIKRLGRGEYYGSFIYKNVHILGVFATRAKDKKRAFLNTLRKLGIRYDVKIRVKEFIWGFEISDSKTGEPLYIALNTDFDFIKGEE